MKVVMVGVGTSEKDLPGLSKSKRNAIHRHINPYPANVENRVSSC